MNKLVNYLLLMAVYILVVYLFAVRKKGQKFIPWLLPVVVQVFCLYFHEAILGTIVSSKPLAALPQKTGTAAAWLLLLLANVLFLAVVDWMSVLAGSPAKADQSEMADGPESLKDAKPAETAYTPAEKIAAAEAVNAKEGEKSARKQAGIEEKKAREAEKFALKQARIEEKKQKEAEARALKEAKLEEKKQKEAQEKALKLEEKKLKEEKQAERISSKEKREAKNMAKEVDREERKAKAAVKRAEKLIEKEEKKAKKKSAAGLTPAFAGAGKRSGSLRFKGEEEQAVELAIDSVEAEEFTSEDNTGMFDVIAPLDFVPGFKNPDIPDDDLELADKLALSTSEAEEESDSTEELLKSIRELIDNGRKEEAMRYLRMVAFFGKTEDQDRRVNEMMKEISSSAGGY